MGKLKIEFIGGYTTTGGELVVLVPEMWDEYLKALVADEEDTFKGNWVAIRASGEKYLVDSRGRPKERDKDTFSLKRLGVPMGNLTQKHITVTRPGVYISADGWLIFVEPESFTDYIRWVFNPRQSYQGGWKYYALGGGHGPLTNSVGSTKVVASISDFLQGDVHMFNDTLRI